MKYSESKPFLNGAEYEIFLDNWCYDCTHYKERGDGIPELTEYGGCPILDAMEFARLDLKFFPSDDIIEERDEGGNVLYWHKCTKFKRRKTDGQRENE